LPLLLILAGWAAEEEEQDQREDEGAAEPHTKLQQGQQYHAIFFFINWTCRVRVSDGILPSDE
jgi:hypothetical protein